MKKKTAIENLKSLRVSYKIALVFALVSVVANIVSFFFILLPTYDLASKSLQDNSNDTDKRIEEIAEDAEIAQYVTYASIVIATLSGAYGVGQDVSSKSKK